MIFVKISTGENIEQVINVDDIKARIKKHNENFLAIQKAVK